MHGRPCFMLDSINSGWGRHIVSYPNTRGFGGIYFGCPQSKVCIYADPCVDRSSVDRLSKVSKVSKGEACRAALPTAGALPAV